MNITASNATILLIALFVAPAIAAEPQNIHLIANDLTIPEITEEAPAAGKRVRQRLPGREEPEIFHIVYLPIDWQREGSYPVIVEYPGNGGYKNALGDVSTGRHEDCKLGYGITAGRGSIWVSLPFIDPEKKAHSLNWWGDPAATAKYCRDTIEHLCRDFGGDRDRVFLAGFSRGAIACNYIGLRDDDIARLWRGMIVHSHYDGVRRWGYADDDPAAALVRAARFAGRPQFISHEGSIAATRDFVSRTEILAEFTALPYPNHTDTWVLKDIPERKRLRDWYAGEIERPKGEK